MKYYNFISFFFILIFGLFETITAIAISNDSVPIPDDCKVVEEVINMIGNDLQKTYKNLNLINCCNFRQITCKKLNNQTVVTEIKFNNYKNLFNQDMGKIISQFAKLPHLTTLEMSNNVIVGELPNNLSELKNLQKLDLSGNCWKDKNANTKISTEELNKCIISNKIAKEFINNSLGLLHFNVMLIIIGIHIFDLCSRMDDLLRIEERFFNKIGVTFDYYGTFSIFLQYMSFFCYLLFHIGTYSSLLLGFENVKSLWINKYNI